MTISSPTRLAPPVGSRRFVSDESAVTLVIVLLWADIVLPALVQSYTAPKYRATSVEVDDYSSLAGAVDTVLSLAVIALLAVLLLRSLPRLPADRLGVLAVALAPWCWQVGRDVYIGTSPKLGGLLYPLVAFVLWAVRPRIETLRVVGYLVALTAVISVLMGVLTPSRGLLSHAAGDPVTPEKQILPWGILIGPLTDGNPLGQFLSLGAPLTFLIRRRGRRLAALGAIGLAVVWTSNRSSIIALFVALVVAAVLAVSVPVIRRVVATVFLLAGSALVVLLPLTVGSDGAFTNRGWIWRSSIARWKQHEWLGLGSQYYLQSAQQTDNIGPTAFHGHNEFVQTIVLGGLANLVLTGLLLAAVMLAVIRWAARDDVVFPVAWLCMVLVSSCFEITLGFVHRSFLIPVVILPMLFFLFAEPGKPGKTDSPGAPAQPELRLPDAWVAVPAHWSVGADRIGAMTPRRR